MTISNTTSTSNRSAALPKAQNRDATTFIIKKVVDLELPEGEQKKALLRTLVDVDISDIADIAYLPRPVESRSKEPKTVVLSFSTNLPKTAAISESSLRILIDPKGIITTEKSEIKPDERGNRYTFSDTHYPSGLNVTGTKNLKPGVDQTELKSIAFRKDPRSNDGFDIINTSIPTDKQIQSPEKSAQMGGYNTSFFSHANFKAGLDAFKEDKDHSQFKDLSSYHLYFEDPQLRTTDPKYADQQLEKYADPNRFNFPVAFRQSKDNPYLIEILNLKIYDGKKYKSLGNIDLNDGKYTKFSSV